MNILIRNATCLTKDAYAYHQDIYVKEGRIMAIGQLGEYERTATKIVDVCERLVVPGFLDLQVNGGVRKFFTHMPTEETLTEMYEDHLSRGTTSILPTVVTSSFENIKKAISAVRQYWQAGKPGVLGLHVEGPYINIERKGAHNPKYIRKPTDEELTALLQEGQGIIRMITIAPEQFTVKQVSLLKEAGIVVAAGHSAITSEEMKPYFEAGVNCVTHLYNAMSPFLGREPGLTGATLATDVYASIIPDGFHCSMTALNIAYRLKKGKLFFVSDATFIGTENLEMDGIQFIYKDGIYINSQGNLAGSNITMLEAIKVAVKEGGIGIHDAIEMSTAIPAQVLKVDDRYGSVLPGYIADLNILEKETLKLTDSLIKGQFVSQSREYVNSQS